MGKSTCGIDSCQLIFKGDLEKSRENPLIERIFQVLKKLFGGLYITSNAVETVFNIKSKFSPHRTVKAGKRLFVCLLYSQIILKKMKKYDLKLFLKEKVLTYDYLIKNVLIGTGKQKNLIPEKSFSEKILDAIENQSQLIITYCDRFKKYTTRVIEPENLIKNEYNSTSKIEAFCKLREEKRTFYLDRIRDVHTYNPQTYSF